jgi:hypothetical protein
MIDRDLMESSWTIAQLASALGTLTPWVLTCTAVLWLTVFWRVLSLGLRWGHTRPDGLHGPALLASARHGRAHEGAAGAHVR